MPKQQFRVCVCNFEKSAENFHHSAQEKYNIFLSFDFDVVEEAVEVTRRAKSNAVRLIIYLFIIVYVFNWKWFFTSTNVIEGKPLNTSWSIRTCEFARRKSERERER